MAMETNGKVNVDRALLTKAQREFLQGEREVENPDQYRYSIRRDFRNRMEELERDLELLEAAGQDDLIEEFHSKFARVGRLEKEVERLREELEAEESGGD